MLSKLFWNWETKSRRRDSACEGLVSLIEAREDNRWTDSLASSVKDKSTLPWTSSSQGEVVNNSFASARYLCKYKCSDIELQNRTFSLSCQPPWIFIICVHKFTNWIEKLESLQLHICVILLSLTTLLNVVTEWGRLSCFPWWHCPALPWHGWACYHFQIIFTWNLSNFIDKCKLIVTRPSILCVTHQMMSYKWYLMVLGQYMTILDGTWSV